MGDDYGMSIFFDSFERKEFNVSFSINIEHPELDASFFFMNIPVECDVEYSLCVGEMVKQLIETKPSDVYYDDVKDITHLLFNVRKTTDKISKEEIFEKFCEFLAEKVCDILNSMKFTL